MLYTLVVYYIISLYLLYIRIYNKYKFWLNSQHIFTKKQKNGT